MPETIIYNNQYYEYDVIGILKITAENIDKL